MRHDPASPVARIVRRRCSANSTVIANRKYNDIFAPTKLKQDDIEYAIENTRVILAPEQQIATFGNTSFDFHLVSELMDRVNEVRVRTGRIEAERPRILSPEYFARFLLDG